MGREIEFEIYPEMIAAGEEYLAGLLVDGEDSRQIAIGVFSAMLRAMRRENEHALGQASGPVPYSDKELSKAAWVISDSLECSHGSALFALEMALEVIHMDRLPSTPKPPGK